MAAIRALIGGDYETFFWKRKGEQTGEPNVAIDGVLSLDSILCFPSKTITTMRRKTAVEVGDERRFEKHLGTHVVIEHMSGPDWSGGEGNNG